MEQSREWLLPFLHVDVVAIEKEAFGSPSTKVANLYIYIYRERERERGWYSAVPCSVLLGFFVLSLSSTIWPQRLLSPSSSSDLGG